MSHIQKFTLHNDRGQSVEEKNLLLWEDNLHHPSGIFGPIVRYSWETDKKSFESPNTGYWRLLPDASGFICFEKMWIPNNCVLLDAYGKERMRLTVPWQMTGATQPEAGLAPTSFDNVSEPCTNPATGEVGKFGVSAHIGNGIDSKFYFELDWTTGQFLWCRQIRD